MKRIKFLAIMALAATTLFSCNADRDEVVLEPTNVVAAQFENLPTAPVILDENSPEGMAPILFTWTKAQYGYSAAVTYTVQAASENSDVYTELLQSSRNYNTMTNKALNNKLLGMKLKPNEISNIKLRVISSVGESYPDTISKVQIVAIQPYKTVIIYPSLGVVGSFQGWAPENPQTRAWSVENNGKYTGWIDFSSPDPIEFKVVDGFEWGKDVGGPAPTVEANGIVKGTLSGGDNIKGVPAGYYRFDCNWIAKTYTMTPVKSWGVVGAATPGGWDNSTPMTYDKATNLWTLDVTMSAGEWKFRADNGWDISYGAGADEGELVAGGNNFKIEAGTYTITLNLGIAIPTYQFVKK